MVENCLRSQKTASKAFVLLLHFNANAILFSLWVLFFFLSYWLFKYTMGFHIKAIKCPSELGLLITLKTNRILELIIKQY